MRITKASVQWWPNLIAKEWRLCLLRLCWDRGTPGVPPGYSSKLSVSLCFRPCDFWVGVRLIEDFRDRFALVNILPGIQVRIHRKVSYGGSMVADARIL